MDPIDRSSHAIQVSSLKKNNVPPSASMSSRILLDSQPAQRLRSYDITFSDKYRAFLPRLSKNEAKAFTLMLRNIALFTRLFKNPTLMSAMHFYIKLKLNQAQESNSSLESLKELFENINCLNTKMEARFYFADEMDQPTVFINYPEVLQAAEHLKKKMLVCLKRADPKVIDVKVEPLNNAIDILTLLCRFTSSLEETRLLVEIDIKDFLVLGNSFNKIYARDFPDFIEYLFIQLKKEVLMELNITNKTSDLYEHKTNKLKCVENLIDVYQKAKHLQLERIYKLTSLFGTVEDFFSPKESPESNFSSNTFACIRNGIAGWSIFYPFIRNGGMTTEKADSLIAKLDLIELFNHNLTNFPEVIRKRLKTAFDSCSNLPYTLDKLIELNKLFIEKITALISFEKISIIKKNIRSLTTSEFSCEIFYKVLKQLESFKKVLLKLLGLI